MSKFTPEQQSLLNALKAIESVGGSAGYLKSITASPLDASSVSFEEKFDVAITVTEHPGWLIPISVRMAAVSEDSPNISNITELYWSTTPKPMRDRVDAEIKGKLKASSMKNLIAAASEWTMTVFGSDSPTVICFSQDKKVVAMLVAEKEMPFSFKDEGGSCTWREVQVTKPKEQAND